MIIKYSKDDLSVINFRYMVSMDNHNHFDNIFDCQNPNFWIEKRLRFVVINSDVCTIQGIYYGGGQSYTVDEFVGMLNSNDDRYYRLLNRKELDWLLDYLDKGYKMNKKEALVAMLAGEKLTHIYFSDDELVMENPVKTKIYTEYKDFIINGEEELLNLKLDFVEIDGGRAYFKGRYKGELVKMNFTQIETDGWYFKPKSTIKWLADSDYCVLTVGGGQVYNTYE